MAQDAPWLNRWLVAAVVDRSRWPRVEGCQVGHVADEPTLSAEAVGLWATMRSWAITCLFVVTQTAAF